MTEEEKKAIENLGGAIGRRDCTDLYWKDADIIYDLIQKQDTEINKLNNVIDRMAKDIRQTNKNLIDEGYYVEPFWLDKEDIKEYFMKEDNLYGNV